jgi:class 3 adenylate cyclase/tetratricopeptide (TPR) repeat protein
MKCSNCGFENPASFKFCGECGAKLKNICPNCNFENPPNFKFCGECGNPLTITPKQKELKKQEETKEKEKKETTPEEKKEELYEGKEVEKITETQKEKVKKEGERRPISVLFADISGFTSLSEKLDPEELQFFIGDVLRKLADIVKRNGGYVDKFIGDEVMALFGAPFAYGNDTERAVRTAIEMMDFIRTNYQNISLHCGIGTGEAVVGSISEREKDYTAMGDTVNIAKRLEEESSSWEILVDENTFLLTKHIFDYKPVDVKLKGKEKDTKVYLLLGPKKHQVVFIGREKEIEEINRILDKKRSRIAILGEAGTGVSRLIKTIAEQRSDVFLAKLSSKNEPYGVIKNILTSVIGNQIDQKKILEIAEKFDLSFHFLGYIFGINFPDSILNYISPEKIEEETLKVSNKIISLLFKDKVIAIDNFDKIDHQSQNIFISNGEKEFSVLLGIEKGGFDEKKLKDFRIIYLQNFNFEETKKFISQILESDIDEQTAKIIWERTSGNPLFIYELVELLRENNQFERVNGKIKIKENTKIPKAIGMTQVILSRIDKLPQSAREVLSVMSCLDSIHKDIIERFFSSKPEYLQSLKLLKEKDIIREEYPFFFFSQNILKEIVYETLLKAKRIEIHSALFEIAREICKDDITLILIAGEQAEKSERFKDAFLMYKKAGEISKIKHNIKNAKEYFEKALNLLQKAHLKIDEISEVYDFLIEYGEILYRTGEIDRAIEIFEKSRNFSQDEIKLAIAKRWIADCLQIKGNFELAEKIYLEVLQIFKNRKKSEYIKTLALLCHLFVDKSLPEEAIKYVNELLNSIDNEIKTENQDIYAEALNAIGRAYFLVQDYEKAKKFFGELYDTTLKLSDIRKRGIATINYGAVHYMLGNHDTALLLFKEYLEIAKSIMDVRGEALALANISQILFERGNIEKAMENLKKSIDIFEKIGDEYGTRETKYMLAKMKIFIGETEEGRKIIEELYKKTDSNYKKAEYETLIALSLVLEGKFAPAKELLKQAKEKYENVQNQTEFKITLSRIKLNENEFEEAEKIAEESFEKAKTEIEKIISCINGIKIIKAMNLELVIHKDKLEKYQKTLENLSQKVGLSQEMLKVFN